MPHVTLNNKAEREAEGKLAVCAKGDGENETMCGGKEGRI